MHAVFVFVFGLGLRLRLVYLKRGGPTSLQLACLLTFSFLLTAFTITGTVDPTISVGNEGERSRPRPSRIVVAFMMFSMLGMMLF